MFVAALTSVLLISSSSPFVNRPYLQLGAESVSGDRSTLSLVWHAPAGSQGWSVRYETPSLGKRLASAPVSWPVRARGVVPHDVYLARFTQLKPGERIRYEVLQAGKVVSSLATTAPKAAGQPIRFALIGDTGRNTPGQRAVAAQLAKQRPDAAIVTGDIVYAHGQMSEYKTNWFDLMNGDKMPLLGQTLFVGVTGNHDTAYRNLAKYPDGLAYYAYWRQPLNGPPMPRSVGGSADQQSGLAAASGPWLNKGGNFSFDLGDVHWTVLDSNTYADWTRPDLLRWLESDLRDAQNRAWRFVTFHHAPYHSSEKKKREVYMQSLTGIFNRYRVQMVFSGHVHNYQRTYPLTGIGAQVVPDRVWDGVRQTRTNGTIFVVTGAGGAELYDQKLADKPSKWRPWTAVYKAGYGLTLLDVDSRNVHLRQLDAKGRVIDEMRLTR